MNYLKKFNELHTTNDYLDLIENHKEDARDRLYDLTDRGYNVHPSAGNLMSYFGSKFVNYSVRITKYWSENSIKPFEFTDIIDEVDDFIHYVKEVESNKDPVKCKVTFYDHQQNNFFHRDNGSFQEWNELKEKMALRIELNKEMALRTNSIEFNAKIVSLDIYYRIDF